MNSLNKEPLEDISFNESHEYSQLFPEAQNFLAVTSDLSDKPVSQKPHRKQNGRTLDATAPQVIPIS